MIPNDPINESEPEVTNVLIENYLDERDRVAGLHRSPRMNASEALMEVAKRVDAFRKREMDVLDEWGMAEWSGVTMGLDWAAEAITEVYGELGLTEEDKN